MGLAEADGEPFAGDCVGRAGGVADERCEVIGDTVKLAGCGHGAALLRDLLRAVQAARDLREAGEDVGAIAFGVARDVDHADAVRRDGRDVKLAAAGPVYFHKLAPGRYLIVRAESETQVAPAHAVQTRPLAHRRGLAVRTDEPAIAHRLAVDESGAMGIRRGAVRHGRGSRRELNVAVPQQLCARLFGTRGEQGVQMRAAHAHAGAVGEAGVDVVRGVCESDAAEGMSIRFGERYAKLGERLP